MTLMNYTPQFGEIKITMVTRIYIFKVVMGAKEKYKRVFGGIDTY